jgi:hypothetical protein
MAGYRAGLNQDPISARVISSLPFDQIERVAAELFEAPAFAVRGRRARPPPAVPVFAAGQQARGDVDLAAADLEQQLEQVGHQRAFLAQPGAARGARRAFRRRSSGLRLASAAISRAPMSLSFQPAESPRTLAGRPAALGGWRGDVGQRLVLDDAAARDVLVLRLAFAPCASAFRRPSTSGLRPGDALIRFQHGSGSLR